MAKKSHQNSGDHGFCTVYKNRKGKIMRAADYGYKAWPFGRKK